MAPEKPRRERRLGFPSEAATLALALVSLFASVGGAIGGALVVALPALVAILGSALGFYFANRTPGAERTLPTLQERIDALAGSLSDASHVIAAIESEIRARRALVDELQHDANRYEELARLHADEVQAIVEALQGELRVSERRASRTTLIQGFSFFVLGVAATVVVSLLAA